MVVTINTLGNCVACIVVTSDDINNTAWVSDFDCVSGDSVDATYYSPDYYYICNNNLYVTTYLYNHIYDTTTIYYIR